MAGFTSNRHLPGFAKSVRRLRRFVPRVLVAAALLWTAGSTLCVYPHQLAYFNELAGGPENGHRHLLGSNLDWGQDVLSAITRQRRHPSATRPLLLLRYGYDPKVLGLDGINLHEPRWCEALVARTSEQSEVLILLRKQFLVAEADCLSKLNIEVIYRIDRTIILLRCKGPLQHVQRFPIPIPIISHIHLQSKPDVASC